MAYSSNFSMLKHAPAAAIGAQLSYSLITASTINPVVMVALTSIASLKIVWEFCNQKNQASSDFFSKEIAKLRRAVILGSAAGLAFGCLHRVSHSVYTWYTKRQLIKESKIDHANSLISGALDLGLPRAEHILINSDDTFAAYWQATSVGTRNFPKLDGAETIQKRIIVGYDRVRRFVSDYSIFSDKPSEYRYIVEDVPIYASCIGYKMPLTGWTMPQLPEFKMSNFSIVAMITGAIGARIIQEELDRD